MLSDARSVRFPLSSDQCELLLAFEDATTLAELGRRVLRDVSVVSRQLSALAAAAPVIEKQQGRWRITAFGRQMNNLSRATVAGQRRILEQQAALRLSPARLPSADDGVALLVTCVQQGFDDPAWGARNNPQAEDVIAALLSAWRQAARPVVYCQHVSPHPGSPLRGGTAGCDFKAAARPAGGEQIVRKAANSAFFGTDLATRLNALGCRAVVLVGFTTNHCIDATARMAGDLGFHAVVVADATATFDRVGWDGRAFKAEDLHAAALASLSQEFATITESEELLRQLRGDGVEE